MAAQRGAGGSSLTERLESRRRTVHAAQATAAIHDYTGHGTTRLLAALEVASDKAHGRCPRRRTQVEFVAILGSIARGYTGRGERQI
jgi:hypothetical protein